MCSPLVGKGWPRGGGVWDQNPVLVKHFRLIQQFEREWKETQESSQSGGDGLGSALEQYVAQLEQQGESTAL